MVFCIKCGTNNTEGVTVCVTCGAPLQDASSEPKSHVRYGHYGRESPFSERGRFMMGILIGLIILFVGFSLLVEELYRINIPWGPIILILAGVFILIRFFRRQSRRQ